MFASNDQKELAKANLHEVYELAKNDTSIHLEEYDESHDLQTEDNEVGRYLVMAQIKNDQDPLKWWDVNKSQFLILAQLARKYLCIQATLGASERVFSDAGLIMSSKRTSMKEDLFEALIFLKRNGDLVGVGEMFS
ncbi:unnamed protein product [Rhizophagus irregularis]|nr:unnamed protein product [Rhizophagus irregularis]